MKPCLNCSQPLEDSDPELCTRCDLHAYEAEIARLADPFNNVGRFCAVFDRLAAELGCPTGRSLKVVEYLANREHEYLVEWEADGSVFRTPVALREMRTLY